MTYLNLNQLSQKLGGRSRSSLYRDIEAEATALAYRKSLWVDTDEIVEIWLEKNALADVIAPVTSEYDVPLMATSGFTSETFAFESVDDMRYTGKRLVIYTLYDFDRSGHAAEQSLREKVYRFGADFGVPVAFHSLALSAEQVEDWTLPTRPHKRATTADEAWPYPVAAELDAIPPEQLRELVRGAIEKHLPAHEAQYCCEGCQKKAARERRQACGRTLRMNI